MLLSVASGMSFTAFALTNGDFEYTVKDDNTILICLISEREKERRFKYVY